jgi:F0F1-type ATP synthase assembly protein I
MGAWRAAALATEFGFSVVGSMVGGIVVGRFLDERLGTTPVFFLVGLLFGMLFSIYLIYVIYRLQIVAPKAPSRAGSVPPSPAVPHDSDHAER